MCVCVCGPLFIYKTLAMRPRWRLRRKKGETNPGWSAGAHPCQRFLKPNTLIYTSRRSCVRAIYMCVCVWSSASIRLRMRMGISPTICQANILYYWTRLAKGEMYLCHSISILKWGVFCTRKRACLHLFLAYKRPKHSVYANIPPLLSE